MVFCSPNWIVPLSSTYPTWQWRVLISIAYQVDRLKQQINKFLMHMTLLIRQCRGIQTVIKLFSQLQAEEDKQAAFEAKVLEECKSINEKTLAIEEKLCSLQAKQEELLAREEALEKREAALVDKLDRDTKTIRAVLAGGSVIKEESTV